MVAEARDIERLMRIGKTAVPPWRRMRPDSWRDTARAIESLREGFDGKVCAGAIGLGVGGSQTRRELVERGAFDQITAPVAAYIKAANSGA